MIKRVMFVTILTLLSGYLFKPGVRQYDRRCPKCTHLSVQVNNIPEQYKDHLNAFTAYFKRLYDPDCDNGVATQETCQKPKSSALSVVKCQTTRITFKANRFIQFLPESQLVIELLLRECTTAKVNVPDGCIALQDLREEERAKITKQLHDITTNNWDNATIAGEVCATSQF